MDSTSVLMNHIQQRLQDQFAPAYLRVEDESHLHGGGRGVDTHFKVILVSSQFEVLTRVDRQRAVMRLLSVFRPPVHALALHLLTPQEWVERQGMDMPGSECASRLGG